MIRTPIRDLCLSAAMLLAQAAASLAGSTGTLDRVSGWYAAGTTFTITATAAQYSKFGSWSGDTNGCTAAGSQLTVPVNMFRRIEASFVPKLAPLGTPESWLARYGLTNGLPGDIELDDEDGDTAPAWKEYIAGTDPTNHNDRFNVYVAYSNGSAVVSFQTRTATPDYYGGLARFYALEYVTNMLNTNWNVITGFDNLPASGQAIIYTNVVVGNPLLYRAKAWLR